MIVGIDEVGRGCWAGPVVAAAVLLGKPVRGLKDSKKLTKLQRERLAILVHKRAAATGIGWVPASEVDAIGLTRAVGLAMRRALEQLEQIAPPYERIIIDGNFNFLADHPKSEVLIKADDIVPAVSAASIIAKVARDNYMAEVAKQFPGYAFESHVGYGTRGHRLALQKLGVCELHRRSFAPIRAML